MAPRVKMKRVLPCPPPLETLVPSPRRVARIDRVVQEHGVQQLSAVLLSHIIPERGAEKVKSVREVATELHISKSTAQRMLRDLPLRDVSNISHTKQHVAVREMLARPAASVTPTVKPFNSYLTLVEEDLLCKIITDRAVNDQAIGGTAIRNIARDMKATRVREKVDLPSTSWFKRFRIRHKERFKSKRGGRKEHRRADAERSEEVRGWFDELKGHYDQHGFEPHEIFAMDETGIAGEAGLNEKVLVPIEHPQAVQLTGSFREHISIMHMCQADGISLSPMFVFQGTWTPQSILDGAPEGSKVAMQESGYFEKKHLRSVFEHIIEFTESRRAQYYVTVDGVEQRRQIILILDGAKGHLCSDALQYAVDNRMTVFKLPAHMTHLMQVSDVAVFGPFKHAYAQACEEWRQEHEGPITKYHVCSIIAKAWIRAMSSENVKSGFHATGQWPLDPQQVLKKVSNAHSFSPHHSL
jgi:hypothetical protein